MSNEDSRNDPLIGFTEVNLIDMLDTLKDEYPIAESVTYGELEELGTWITDLYPEVLDLINVKLRMFLETVEGRDQEGKR